MSGKMHRIRRMLAVILVVVLALPANIMSQGIKVNAAQKVRLSKEKVTLYLNQNAALGNQQTFDLAFLNLPADWKDKWSISFQSEKKEIAAVNAAGTVTAKKTGGTTILCTITNIKTKKKVSSLSCAITVKENAKSVSITNLPKESFMAIGVPQNFNVKLKGSSGQKATDKTEWVITGNTAGAKVSASGVVTAAKAGKFTLTAKTYPDKTARKSLGTKAYTAVSKPVTIQVLKDAVITGNQVTNGAYVYENQKVGNLTVKQSVGDARISLNNVLVAGKLILEDNAGYQVTLKDSRINRTETKKTDTKSAKAQNVFEKLALLGVKTVSAAEEAKTPELVVSDGSTITIINVGGTISIKQEGSASIASIQITTNASGQVEVKLDGFSGNLVVDTGAGANTTVTTTGCNIASATILGDSGSHRVELRDPNAGTESASTIGAVNVAGTTEVLLDIKTEVLTVASQAAGTTVTVSQPVSLLQNSGTESRLVINAEVKEIKSEGEKALIQVEKSGKVESVAASGNSTAISGEGTVVSAVVAGNNSSVNTNGTKVEVKEEATGVKVGNKEVKGGSSVTSTATPTPTPTVTPTPTQSPVVVPTSPAAPTPDPAAKEKAIYSRTVKSLMDTLNAIDSHILSDKLEPVSAINHTSATDRQLTYNILMHRKMGSFITDDVWKGNGPDHYTLDDYYAANTASYSLANAKQVRDGAYLLAAYYQSINETVPNFSDGKLHDAIIAVLEALQELRTENYTTGDSWWSIKANDFTTLKKKLADLYSLEDAITLPNFNEAGPLGTSYYQTLLTQTQGNNDFYYKLAESLLYDLNTQVPPPGFSCKDYYDSRETMSAYYETYGDWFITGNINYNMIEAKKNLEYMQSKNGPVKTALELINSDTAEADKKKAALLQVIDDQEFDEYSIYDIWYKTGKTDENGDDIWDVVEQGIYSKDELKAIINSNDYFPYILRDLKNNINDPGNNLPNNYNPLHTLIYGGASGDLLKCHTDYQISEDAKWSLLSTIVNTAYAVRATVKESTEDIINTLKTVTTADNGTADITGSVYENNADKGFNIIIDERALTEDDASALREVKDNDVYYKVLVKTLAQRMYYDSSSSLNALYQMTNQPDIPEEMYLAAFHEIYQAWLGIKDLTDNTIFPLAKAVAEAVFDNMEMITENSDTPEAFTYSRLKASGSLVSIRDALLTLSESYSTSGDDQIEAGRVPDGDDPGYLLNVQKDMKLIREVADDDYYLLKVAENLTWLCLYTNPDSPEQSSLYKILHQDTIPAEEACDTYNNAINDICNVVLWAYYDKSYDTFLCLRKLAGSVNAATTVSGSAIVVTSDEDKLNSVGDSLWNVLDLTETVLAKKNETDWQEAGAEMTRQELNDYMTPENVILIIKDIVNAGYVVLSETGPISWNTIQLEAYSGEASDIQSYYRAILEALDRIHSVLYEQMAADPGQD